MKWIGESSYIRVTKRGPLYFIHLVVETFTGKQLLPVGQSEDRIAARQLAIQEAATRKIAVRLED